MKKKVKLNRVWPFDKLRINFGLILFLLLIPSLLLNFFLYQRNQRLGQGIKVLEVLDGDTIKISV